MNVVLLMRQDAPPGHGVGALDSLGRNVSRLHDVHRRTRVPEFFARFPLPYWESWNSLRQTHRSITVRPNGVAVLALLVLTVAALPADAVVTRAALFEALHGVVFVLGSGAEPVGEAVDGDTTYGHGVLSADVHEVLDATPSRVAPRVQMMFARMAGRRRTAVVFLLSHNTSDRSAGWGATLDVLDPLPRNRMRTPHPA